MIHAGGLLEYQPQTTALVQTEASQVPRCTQRQFDGTHHRRSFLSQLRYRLSDLTVVSLDRAKFNLADL
jgi:hypothetical protein